MSWKEQICHQPNLFRRIKRDKQAVQAQRIRQAFGLQKTSWKPPLAPSFQFGKLNQLHKGRVDEANFAVLRAPDIPSILVETAFLSNPTEERLLGSDSFRRQCADAIATGIQKYVNTAALRRG